MRDEHARSTRTIGFLTTGYPRSEADAAGLFVRGMARALRDRGHRIEVLAPAPPEGGLPSEEAIDVEAVRYAPRPFERTFYGAGVPDNVVRDLRSWPGLVTFPPSLLRAAYRHAPRWDAIVSHWALPCGMIAGMVRGPRPHLSILHSADVHVIRRAPLRSALASRVADSASNLLFASSALRSEFLSWLPRARAAEVSERSHASAMGIDPPMRLEPPTRDGSRFTVLTLARLVPIKGVIHAIEAIASEPSMRLVVAGEGPERASLERAASRLGADVTFVGHVSGLDKATLFGSSDALLLPSIPLSSGRTEGTPTVALEAASYGLPIVACETGGLFEVFEQERSAIAVPPRDVPAMRRALRRLRDDAGSRQRLGSAAKRAAARYEWPVLITEIEALIR